MEALLSFHFIVNQVEVTGLEPATAWSQTRNATNCATPRCKRLRLANLPYFAVVKVLTFSEPRKYFLDYFCVT